MTYNDFTLDALIAQFSLQVQEESDYFALFAPLPLSDLLRQTLQENVPLALDISTEKARSECKYSVNPHPTSETKAFSSQSWYKGGHGKHPATSHRPL